MLSLCMHKIVLRAVLLLLVSLRGNAQTDSAANARQIIKLEQQLQDALPGDTATWNKYLDPKLHVVDEDGAGAFKKEFLATMGPFPKSISGHVWVTQPVFVFHDNVAVIQYVADEYEQFFNAKLHTSYATTDTWYKTASGWVMLSMQVFEIPALPPAITLDTRVLKQYTGVYKLGDEDTATITLKNDTLFIQKSGRKPDALFAETNNVFFRKSDARGRKLFVEDEVGNMLMLERRNGQDVVWKRASRRSTDVQK